MPVPQTAFAQILNSAKTTSLDHAAVHRGIRDCIAVARGVLQEAFVRSYKTSLNALLLQPPTNQKREWIEAFGLAWQWTDVFIQVGIQN